MFESICARVFQRAQFLGHYVCLNYGENKEINKHNKVFYCFKERTDYRNRVDVFDLSFVLKRIITQFEEYKNSYCCIFKYITNIKIKIF